MTPGRPRICSRVTCNGGRTDNRDPPPRPPRRHRAKASHGRIFLRRVIALAFVVGLLAILVGSAWAILGGRGEEAAPPAKPAPPPKTLRIIFPEGFTLEQMATRIGEVNKIAEAKRNVEPRLSPSRYRALTAGSSRVPPQFLTEGRPPNLEGFLFPATYEFTAKTTTRQLVNKQLVAFRRNWSRPTPRRAREEPDAVRRPDHRLDGGEGGDRPEERALVAAVIYNRLKAGMTLGIDATIRYGLNVLEPRSPRESHSADPTPYNTRSIRGCRRRRSRTRAIFDAGGRHPAKTNYLFARKPGQGAPFLHRVGARVHQLPERQRLLTSR